MKIPLSVKTAHWMFNTSVCVHILLGLLLPLAANIPVVREMLLAFLPGLAMSSALESQIIWLITIIGPTVASWALLLGCLKHVYCQGRAAHADDFIWWSMMVALWLWFLVDTSWSITNGIIGALLLNIPAFLSFFLPLCRFRQVRRSAARQSV